MRGCLTASASATVCTADCAWRTALSRPLFGEERGPDYKLLSGKQPTLFRHAGGVYPRKPDCLGDRLYPLDDRAEVAPKLHGAGVVLMLGHVCLLYPHFSLL